IEAALFDQLTASRRAATFRSASETLGWVAAERIPELRAIHSSLALTPAIEPPRSRAERAWNRHEAIASMIRGRSSITGPTTAAPLAASLGVSAADAEQALIALESDGAVLRGSFETRGGGEWCDRRLLARIHRYTLNRLRAEIEPVSPAEFMRFLFAWQHVAPAARLTGADGLREVVQQLDGFEAPASAWERTILPARVEGYDPSLLDTLCLTGEI